MPELIRTVRCNLEVDPQQALILHETMARFAAACQDIHQVALQYRTTNKVAVQHICYRTIKARYGLQANLVIRAIARVCEAMKPDPERQRTFRPTSVSLDQRTFRWIPEKESISVSTHAGRLVLPVRIGQYQRDLLAGRNPTSATLVYSRRKRHFHIHIVVSTTVPEPHGIRALHVDPRNTSRQCPRCGHIDQENRLIHGTFRCQACGFQHHADIVASINIARRAGSPATGCGHTALKARRMTLQGTARGADARAKPLGFSPCGL